MTPKVLWEVVKDTQPKPGLRSLHLTIFAARRSRFDEVGEKLANLTILVDRLIERHLGRR